MIGCEFRSPQGPQRGATAGSGCGDFFRDVEHYSALTLSKEPNAMPKERLSIRISATLHEESYAILLG